MPGQVEQLGITPVIEDEGWAGYQHFTDPTRLPFNVLTYPSHNCSMPSNDKIVPDLGKLLLGQEWTENSGIIGNQQKFTTTSGDELEVRVWTSETAISVLLTSIIGTFEIGETITGGGSGATGVLVAKVLTDPIFPSLILRLVSHAFNVGETVTGGTSGATATVTADNTARGDVIEVLYTSQNPLSTFYNTQHWYAITQPSNPLPAGLHRYSFDQWFDTGLDPSAATNLNVPRLVWVNGNTEIDSWIGAIAEIVLVTTDVATGYTYLSVDSAEMILSFVSGPFTIGEKVTCGSGSGGVFYVAGLSSLNTIVTMILIVETGSDPFPVGGTVVGATSGVTGTIGKVIIPAQQKTWGALGFSDAGNNHVVVDGIPRQINIVGSPTPLGGYGTPDVAISPTTPTIHPGDIGFSLIRQDIVSTPLDFCRNNKNNMYYGWWKSRQLFMSNEFERDSVSVLTPSINVVLNDLWFPAVPQYNGTDFETYTINIVTVGTTDQYNISKLFNGSTVLVQNATNIVAGSNFILPSPGGTNQITLKFGSATGHTLGDSWTITLSPPVTEAWINFNYNLPVRLPGQGYIFSLPSNFWTMDTQENVMYVNTKYGEWGTIVETLSADLLSENVEYTPLKQAGALKVIDPWMTGHMEDDLVFVTSDKSLMDIGRQAFLEKPQDGYMSDPVRYDFLPCSFVGGSIEYIQKKLYISSPEQGITHCLDVAKKYWQPPKTFTEVGILSLIEDTLICHSNIRNQSFTMFASASDNGQEYEVLARSPLNAYFKLVARKRIPARWDLKFSNQTFMEGYITGNPQLSFTVFLGPNDSNGLSHIVKPIIQNNSSDVASIGAGSIASHPLGNDLAVDGQYFQEVYNKFSPIMKYYFVALQFKCISSNHSYSVLAMGVNMAFAPTANNLLLGDKTIL